MEIESTNPAQKTTETQSGPPLKVTVQSRLCREKRWAEAAIVRDELMKKYRAEGLSREDAQHQTYLELDKRFPPLEQLVKAKPPTRKPGRPRKWNKTPVGEEVGNVAQSDLPASGDTITQKPSKNTGEASVSGISDLPISWPPLPPNAQLGIEISWVQANRLRCVRERGDSIVVDLRHALTPAPSYSALGWLETSIRAYAKFVDVASKATSGDLNEIEGIRREKMAIEDVKRLLAEMLEDEAVQSGVEH